MLELDDVCELDDSMMSFGILNLYFNQKHVNCMQFKQPSTKKHMQNSKIKIKIQLTCKTQEVNLLKKKIKKWEVKLVGNQNKWILYLHDIKSYMISGYKKKNSLHTESIDKANLCHIKIWKQMAVEKNQVLNYKRP